MGQVTFLIPLDDLRLSALDGEIPQATVTRGIHSWTVAGAILEGAWSFGDEILVATTDDIPYEEGLNFSLLSPDGRVVEQVLIEHMYTTGSFESLGTEGANLRFRFFGDTDWVLRVKESPQFRLPFFGDPRGVVRPWGTWKRLLIEGNPKPGP